MLVHAQRKATLQPRALRRRSCAGYWPGPVSSVIPPATAWPQLPGISRASASAVTGIAHAIVTEEATSGAVTDERRP